MRIEILGESKLVRMNIISFIGILIKLLNRYSLVISSVLISYELALAHFITSARVFVAGGIDSSSGSKRRTNRSILIQYGYEIFANAKLMQE
jgi:hypothetical protein